MRRPVKPFVTEYRGSSRRQGAGGQGPKQDLFNAEPKPPAALHRPASPDPQEDSYEAALRAADAFFSTRGEPRSETTASAPRQQEAPEGASAASASGGRVFRDLNEPQVSPEMLQLEAERAPKRRGRKPGSKNKPKPLAPVAAQEAVVAHAAPGVAPAIPARVFVLPRGAARAPVANAGERYAWVRTKLKPGQQWKRRLPKVAW